ncbi:transcriptional regulator [Thetidibacter halocola]|uniref:Transcriptional regulator n=1 Tax=Thetidibacter halocola TaxID=2827239 RepID=A0A8J7WFN7_9RHOB|nr:transcriptional regulator [Thetidibacter halocola]MBS0124836.1 transcriptional regulator [Thetidibacter halocola]
MAKATDRVRITVLGPFRVEAGCGSDITPKGAKNQALLAILALSPDMARPRRWLEDRLWSTFGPEQASANLRQALSKLRSALGGEILLADRTTVSLDPARVAVDLLETVLPEDPRTELLQGLDVRDPEFEEWLRMERAELERLVARARPGTARGVLIGVRSEAQNPGRDPMLGEILANQIGENIAEHVRAWRQAEDGALPGAPPADVNVVTQVVPDGNGHTIFIKAVHQPSARILYSKLLHLDRIEDILETQETVAKTVFEAADHVVGKIPLVLDSNRAEARATSLSRLALYRMFSFESDSLREAWGLMNQAFQHDENGLYLAWGSMIRLTQMMEMPAADQAALLEEADALQARALEMNADNPLVHAIVSKVRGTTLGDPVGVLEEAQIALERNKASAFAWKSLAEAYMLAGRLDEAFDASAKACRIAAGSPFRHYWDTGHCVIAVACNRPDEAIVAGEAAARAAPLSRPALRHLLALYAMRGQLDKAHAVAAKLAKIEPGFSLDRIVNDESYPVRTLRNKGLLEPIRALL